MSIESLHPAEYHAWWNMKDRCQNRAHPRWSSYGGRGIRVCSAWSNSFALFIRDMGLRPDSAKSLDRIDNDKGYEPSNCRWATLSEQNANRRHWKWHDKREEEIDYDSARASAFTLWQEGSLDMKSAKQLGIDAKLLHVLEHQFRTSTS